MKIITKALIKQIVTKDSKEKLKERFKNQEMQLEQECQQLQFEERKLQKKSTASKSEVSNRFQVEINHRKEQIQLIHFKLEQLDILEIGSEITEKEVEALVEVKEGLHWKEINDKSIIIKDDIVIRIDG